MRKTLLSLLAFLPLFVFAQDCDINITDWNETLALNEAALADGYELTATVSTTGTEDLLSSWIHYNVDGQSDTLPESYYSLEGNEIKLQLPADYLKEHYSGKFEVTVLQGSCSVVKDFQFEMKTNCALEFYSCPEALTLSNPAGGTIVKAVVSNDVDSIEWKLGTILFDENRKDTMITTEAGSIEAQISSVYVSYMDVEDATDNIIYVTLIGETLDCMEDRAISVDLKQAEETTNPCDLYFHDWNEIIPLTTLDTASIMVSFHANNWAVASAEWIYLPTTVSTIAEGVSLSQYVSKVDTIMMLNLDSAYLSVNYDKEILCKLNVDSCTVEKRLHFEYAGGDVEDCGMEVISCPEVVKVSESEGAAIAEVIVNKGVENVQWILGTITLNSTIKDTVLTEGSETIEAKVSQVYIAYSDIKEAGGSNKLLVSFTGKSEDCVERREVTLEIVSAECNLMFLACPETAQVKEDEGAAIIAVVVNKEVGGVEWKLGDLTLNATLTDTTFVEGGEEIEALVSKAYVAYSDVKEASSDQLIVTIYGDNDCSDEREIKLEVISAEPLEFTIKMATHVVVARDEYIKLLGQLIANKPYDTESFSVKATYQLDTIAAEVVDPQILFYDENDASLFEILIPASQFNVNKFDLTISVEYNVPATVETAEPLVVTAKVNISLVDKVINIEIPESCADYIIIDLEANIVEISGFNNQSAESRPDTALVIIVSDTAKVNVTSNNVINATSVGIEVLNSLQITGNGTLNINTNGAGIVCSDENHAATLTFSDSVYVNVTTTAPIGLPAKGAKKEADHSAIYGFGNVDLSNVNLKIPAGGYYDNTTYELRTAEGALATQVVIEPKAEDPTAIQQVVMDIDFSQPCEFYDVVGRRVSEIVKGNVYIVRQGDKVMKIMVTNK